MNHVVDDMEIAPSSVVKQAARDFAAALSETPQFKAFEQVARVFQKDEVAQRAELGQYVRVVANVVAAVAQRRLEERREPDAVDAEPLDVVELLRQPLEVAEAVVVRVEEAADADLVEDRLLEPAGV